MYDFKPDASVGKPELYRQLLEASDALTAGEEDAVANMANAAADVFSMERMVSSLVVPLCET